MPVMFAESFTNGECVVACVTIICIAWLISRS